MPRKAVKLFAINHGSVLGKVHRGIATGADIYDEIFWLDFRWHMILPTVLLLLVAANCYRLSQKENELLQKSCGVAKLDADLEFALDP
ncbi:hypothetical protein COOONC_15561 [Cooperia oncophora]